MFHLSYDTKIIKFGPVVFVVQPIHTYPSYLIDPLIDGISRRLEMEDTLSKPETEK